jgi:hypothetical protein
MTQLTVQDRIAQAEAAHREGRIIQGAWRRTNGKEMVCALAAWAAEAAARAAARAAAYRNSAELLFKLIDVELEAVVGA